HGADALVAPGSVVAGQAVVTRQVQHGALRKRGDGQQRVDAERARYDRAIDDVEALVHLGGAGAGATVEHLALVVDDAVAALATDAAAAQRVGGGRLRAHHRAAERVLDVAAARALDQRAERRVQPLI